MKKVLILCGVLATAFVMNAAELDFKGLEITFNENQRALKPAATEAEPVFLNLRQTTYDYAEFDWCYFGFSESAYFGYVIFDENGKEVAFTVMSQSETDLATYNDGVTFKDDEETCDAESHYYISTYWILNCPNGVRMGDDDVVAKCVQEVSNGSTRILALRAGSYYFRVMEIIIENGQASMGSGYAQIPFELRGVVPGNLKAEVSSDNNTASISWTKPSLPADAHLYLNVQSGAEVVFDNINSKKSPDNPLVINVKEGRTYSVSAQYVTSRNVPLGDQIKLSFTVGTNKYVPQNPKAEVTNKEYVDFSWTVDKKSDIYEVNVYHNNLPYASYYTAETKLSKQLEAGTYTWDIAAMEKGEDGYYYPLTEFVAGNSFTTEEAPLPEGTETLNIWAMEAFYMEDYSTEGAYVWIITLETGTQGGTGLPEAWVVLYADEELKLSGSYAPALGNVEISATAGEGCLFNTNGTEAGLITATSAELRLDFDGYDLDYQQLGYYIPYYSGEFKMSLANGKNYYGKLNQLICGAYPYEQMTSSDRTIISLLGEMGLGVENTENAQKIDLTKPMYNVMGVQVGEDYKGVVIQNGKKFLR